MSAVSHEVGETLIIVPLSDDLAVRVGRITSVAKNADGSTTYTLVNPYVDDLSLGYDLLALPDA